MAALFILSFTYFELERMQAFRPFQFRLSLRQQRLDINQPAHLTKTLEAMGWTKEIQQLKREVEHLKSAAPSDSELGDRQSWQVKC